MIPVYMSALMSLILTLFLLSLVYLRGQCLDHFYLYCTLMMCMVSTVSAKSDVNMFADDITLYRIIQTDSDYRHLQDDIDSVAACIYSKNLKFNAEKCKLMLITKKNSKSLPPPDLTLDGTVLRRVFSYIGKLSLILF